MRTWWRLLLAFDPQAWRRLFWTQAAVFLGWTFLGGIETGSWGPFWWLVFVNAFLFGLLMYGGWRKRTPVAIVIIAVGLLWASEAVIVAAPAASVVGVGFEGDVADVTVSAIPYATGSWGTDYLTVAHAMRSRGRYVIVSAGGRRTPARVLDSGVCGLARGVDGMILRTDTANQPVAKWGDPATLTTGTELHITPWPYRPTAVRFLHHAFREWAPKVVLPELDHAVVAGGQGRQGRAGDSGAPWLRDGVVYGMHKATVTVLTSGSRDTQTLMMAEPLARIEECLDRAGYTVPE
jgi:hypothetical protein